MSPAPAPPASHLPFGKGGVFLVGVESLRGLAAFVVLAFHASFCLPQHQGPGTWLPFLFNGPSAVVVFFVMSGLVLGLSLDLRAAASPGAYARFLGRRVFRIYPAHIAIVLAMVAAAWWGAFPPLPAPARGSLLTPEQVAWLDGSDFHTRSVREIALNLALWRHSINTPTWSIFVEIVAAFFLPALHFLTRRGNLLLDIGVCAALAASALFFHALLLPSFLFAFHLGLLVTTRGERVARAVGKHAGLAGGFALSLAGLLLPNVARRATDVPCVVLGEALGGFLLLSLVVWSGDARLRAFLESPPLRWLGKVSYSFYLLHGWLLCLVARALYSVAGGEASAIHPLPFYFAALAGATALTLPLAWASHRWIERPFIGLGKAWVG